MNHRISVGERTAWSGGTGLLPGAALSCAVAVVAVAIGVVESAVFERALIEPLVIAILLGIGVRAAVPRSIGRRAELGVRFVSKDVLEIAVCLLGATMDVPRLFAAGVSLAAGVVALVTLSLGIGVLLCRAAGLPRKLAILVACGNAICGNSAIAAVAPAIGATQEDVAASIAYTAVLGVATVVALPLLFVPLALSEYQFGVLTGLTVYAVPQVLAASFAVGALSGQVATVVKLARVLMLGPVVLFFSLRERARSGGAPPDVRRLVPWFIAGFVVLAAARSTGVLPEAAIDVASAAARWLMVGAMAALGLSVDFHAVRAAGRRTFVAVTASLIALFLLALALIDILSIG